MKNLRRNFIKYVILIPFIFIGFCATYAQSMDWPSYMHDNNRSSKTPMQIDARTLGEAWNYQAPARPQTAWHGPAKWDAYAKLPGLKSMRNYDPVFHTTIADGKLYFGSTVDDAAHCIDTKSGKELWRFITDAPVRIAPSIYNGKVFFGSDDGFGYCVNAGSGKLIWKHSQEEDQSKVLNNGRMISFWPVRTGVLIEDGIAYFAGSLVPWKNSWLYAVNAETGQPTGQGCYQKKLKNTTFEGSFAASKNLLIAPQGRVAPLVFLRKNGQNKGPLPGGGGCYVLVTPDEKVLHGPGNKQGWITASQGSTKEKIATHQNASSMIVHFDYSYLLTDKSISCIYRNSNKVVWKKNVSYPYAMILVDDTLFTGGLDKVAAFSAETGDQIWESAIEGRAFGLAAANNSLYVSTDEGRIYCFESGREKARQIATPVIENDSSKPIKRVSPPMQKVEAEGMMNRWVFHRSALISEESGILKDQFGNNDAAIKNAGDFVEAGELEALEFDGQDAAVRIAEDYKSLRVPTREISVEAWVNIKKSVKWGGITGIIQDNGDFERGWILGYNGKSQFYFGMAGKTANGRLNYLTSKTTFDKTSWYHVAGTYDGQQQKMYVNGKLENTSRSQKGDINYPDSAFYEIGAYHDKDEYHKLNGKIHEVRVYNRVLNDSEVLANYKQKQGKLPADKKVPKETFHMLASGPTFKYTSTKSALIEWETAKACASQLNLTLGGKSWKYEDKSLKKNHKIEIKDLRNRRVYYYQITTLVDGKKAKTKKYECDTFFNYSLPTLAKSKSFRNYRRIQKAAKSILEQSKIDIGIALLIGCDDGGLGYELVSNSNLIVHYIDTDDAKIARLRKNLSRSECYGTRISALKVDSLKNIPLPGAYASLVVSTEQLLSNKMNTTTDEIERLLRPSGGTAILGKNKIVRLPLADAGSWSHQYGASDNSAYGGEKLWGASKTSDFEVQWIGRPGPRYHPERSGRKPAPLSTNGRLFAQGLERIVAIDAYNGSILWSREIPHLGRFNIPHDSSNWCADDDFVYCTVRDKCWKLDAATGEVVAKINLLPGSKSWNYDWSYLAQENDLLIGSSVKQNSAYTNFWGGEGWYDAKSGPLTFKVCSENIFAAAKLSGECIWKYENGVILNPTITISEGKIFFVNNRNSKVKDYDQRRIGLKELWQDQFMVALDAETGNVLWEKPLSVHPGAPTFFMACGEGKIVIVSSANEKFYIYTYDATDGTPIWNKTAAWLKDNHGGHMSRPAIANNTLYVRPAVYELSTGKLIDQQLPGGGCGTYALADSALYFRSGNVTLWDRETAKTSSWDRLRPGCWLSTIPASGMVLSPEGGGGCSCGKWMETSIAFAPLRRPKIGIRTASAKFLESTSVTIAALEDGTIRYTTDNSEPTANSAIYAAPIKIQTSTTIKARLFDTAGKPLGETVSRKLEKIK